MSAGIRLFIYQDAKESITARKVFNVSESEQYIQGICISSNSLRTFRKDRILDEPERFKKRVYNLRGLDIYRNMA